ncbi:heme-binding protein [Herbaspirillum sp. NPDC101397]|uniref:GlcG/HbpS family heme-binding protein n=1 Tax=Herbaspirillum sp. NPDC101397 TaxID=3364006 RepID=UPI003839DAC1
MKRIFLLLALAAQAAGASLQAHAQVLTEKQISQDLARDIAIAAIEQCRKDGYQVTVAVVDKAGQERAVLRDDGAGPSTVNTSRRKAYTAVAFKRSTSETARLIAADMVSANLKDVSDVLILGGGVPVLAGNQIIGAIGVSGAPGGDKDDACAMAAVAKFAGKLQ